MGQKGVVIVERKGRGTKYIIKWFAICYVKYSNYTRITWRKFHWFRTNYSIYRSILSTILSTEPVLNIIFCDEKKRKARKPLIFQTFLRMTYLYFSYKPLRPERRALPS